MLTAAQTHINPPQFPGGEAAFVRYFSSKFRVGVTLGKSAPPGTYMVKIAYTVDSTGTVSNVIAQNDPGYDFAGKVVAVFSNFEGWIPATDEGKKVSFNTSRKFTFVVREKGVLPEKSSLTMGRSAIRQLYIDSLHVTDSTADAILNAQLATIKQGKAVAADPYVGVDQKIDSLTKISALETKKIRQLLDDKQYDTWQRFRGIREEQGEITTGQEVSAEMTSVQLKAWYKDSLLATDTQIDSIVAINKRFSLTTKSLMADTTKTKQQEMRILLHMHFERESCMKSVLTEEQFLKWRAFELARLRNKVSSHLRGE
jgi:hypothetical protein